MQNVFMFTLSKPSTFRIADAAFLCFHIFRKSFWIFLNRLIPGAKRLDAELSKIGGEIFKVGR